MESQAGPSPPIPRVMEAQKMLEACIAQQPDQLPVVQDRLRRLIRELERRFQPAQASSSVEMEIGKRATELERRKVDRRLEGFTPTTSRAWREICERYGSGLNQTELLSLAEVISIHLGLKVDRDAKRRKEVLIKWFDENFDQILPFLDHVILEDSSGKRLVGSK